MAEERVQRRLAASNLGCAIFRIGGSELFKLISGLFQRVASATVLAVALSSCIVATYKTRLAAEDSGRFSFASDSYWMGEKINPVGSLRFPDNVESKAPLMVLLHGTGGVGYRESSWSSFLRDHGVATFVLDYFTPRNVSSTDYDIPRPPKDVWGALKILATHPRIDTERVAIMGFSNGAGLTMSSSDFTSSSDTGGIEPKAYFMLYGGCGMESIDVDSRNAAYRFMVGGDDVLISAANCKLHQTNGRRFGKDVKTLVFPGVHHGFDGIVSAEFTHARWGSVVMQPDERATEKARAEVIETLKQVFGADRVRR